MRKIKGLLLGGAVAAALILPAVPASACQPDGPCPPCDWTTPADSVWTKLTGHKVFHC
jgi:hypothetical protein